MLAVAMVASAIVTLYLGRNVDFSGDELVWVASSPGFNFDILVQPHGGHLLALTRLVYWISLETFGLAYLPFRLLALAGTLSSVALLFVWGRRRVDDWVALGPCLVLLFFGSDFLHLFQGNGFTIMFSLAFGMAALLAIERGDRRGDVLACLMLSLGVFTYTVILAFVAGIGLMLLLQRRFRALWVVFVPVAIYVAWRAWLLIDNVPTTGGGIDPDSVLLIPAWVFQSLAGILAATSGLGFDFSGRDSTDAAGAAGPALALVAFILLLWRISRSGLSKALIVAVSVALSLWTLQAMAAGGGTLRLPGGDSRYMFPGAFVVAIVAWEVARGWRPGRIGLAVIVLFTIAGVGTNLTVMRDKAKLLQSQGLDYRTTSGAGKLVIEGTVAKGGTPGAPDYEKAGQDAVTTALYMTLQDYGRYYLTSDEILAQPNERRILADSVLAGGSNFELTPTAERPVRCEKSTGSDLETGPGKLIVESSSGGEVRIGRFADAAVEVIGSLEPGVPNSLLISPDSSEVKWKIGLPPGTRLCESAKSASHKVAR